MGFLGSIGKIAKKVVKFSIPVVATGAALGLAKSVLKGVVGFGGGSSFIPNASPNLLQRTGVFGEYMRNPVAVLGNKLLGGLGNTLQGMSNALQGVADRLRGVHTVDQVLDRNGYPLTVPGFYDRLPFGAQYGQQIYNGMGQGVYGYPPPVAYGPIVGAPVNPISTLPGSMQGYAVGSASAAQVVNSQALPGNSVFNQVLNAPLFTGQELDDFNKLKPEDQAMMRLQRSQQRYNQMLTLFTNLMMMDHEAKMAIIRNTRG
ncbi:MAG: hypothetical protein ACOZIN_13280 [Myxococcota bacterium]